MEGEFENCHRLRPGLHKSPPSKAVKMATTKHEQKVESRSLMFNPRWVDHIPDPFGT
jgi:hypothetical protein